MSDTSEPTREQIAKMVDPTLIANDCAEAILALFAPLRARLQACEEERDELREVWLPADQTLQCAHCGWTGWRDEEGPHPDTCPIGFLQRRAEAAEQTRDASIEEANRLGEDFVIMRQELDAAIRERDQVRIKLHAADAVMKAIDDAVKAGRLSTRTPITDAREDYSAPFRYAVEMTEALAAARQEIAGLRAALKASQGYRCTDPETCRHDNERCQAIKIALAVSGGAR